MAERAAQPVPQRQVLAVVVVVVDVVVHVVRRAVDERLEEARHAVVAVVDRHRPHVDEQVEHQVGELVHREEEDVHVVRQALQEAVDRVERVARERARHHPHVVRLVHVLVDEPVVHPAVHPVDLEVGEHEEGDQAARDAHPACRQNATCQW